MREIQYIRCVCCGKFSRARNFDLEAIHEFGIWISRFGGRGSITWQKRVLSDDELDLLRQKFSLQLEHIYLRLTGKKLDAEKDFDEMEPVEIRDFLSLGDAEKMRAIKLKKELVGDERVNFKNIGGFDLWGEEKCLENLVEKVFLKDFQDVHF